MLGAAGATAASALVYSWLGGPPVGGTAAVVAGLSGLAYAYACPWDTTGIEEGGAITGCQDGGPDCETLIKYEPHTSAGSGTFFTAPVTYLGPLSVSRVDSPNAGYPDKFTLTVSDAHGTTYDFEQIPQNAKPFTEFVEGSPCNCVTPFPDGPTSPPFVPPDPYVYTDPDDGCQLTVIFESFVQDQAGRLMPVWKIDPVLPARASNGGIIGGCNFAPTIYVQPAGPGGPPESPPIITEPSPTPEGPDGLPWWWPFLEGAMHWAVEKTLDNLFGDLFDPKYAQYAYTFHAACDSNEDGDLETVTHIFPQQSFVDRMLAWQETQADFLQQHLLWKTPTCSGGCSPISGEPVTITWSSDEPAPTSGDRLRKIFTYFDHSGSSQLDHVNWWKDFSWQAGPVIVSVNGTLLGKPQVWASSADEGKRVIQHAATIAKVDMSDAEWLITAPRSSRYGLPGTMRVHRSKDGGFWVTKRDGPDGPPTVYS